VQQVIVIIIVRPQVIVIVIN